MVWCSGWELAAASARAGILGVIGSGSMYPDVLRTHIRRCKQSGVSHFAVNVPLLYPDIEEQMKVILEESVPIVITSAGSPGKYTPMLRAEGCTVAHVVSSARFAEKAEAAGVDAIICEGFEAGGHNGREETTTICLVPEVRQATSKPLLAAGGIGSGRAMLAAMALGADGVQIGSRFVASAESSAHAHFKQAVVQAGEGATVLTLKELAPVRLMRNGFYRDVQAAYQRGADAAELRDLLGRGRAKRGMFEGDMEQGELEIGQVASQFKKVQPVAEIVTELLEEYEAARKSLRPL